MNRIDPSNIPPGVLRLMSAEDRARYGPRGSLTTFDASTLLAAATEQTTPGKADVRAERAIQDELDQWLRDYDYEFVRPPMHVRSQMPLGHPDFTIYLSSGRVVFVESKTATGKLSTEQVAYHCRLQKRGHAVFVCRSLQFAIDCIRAVEHAGAGV